MSFLMFLKAVFSLKSGLFNFQLSMQIFENAPRKSKLETKHERLKLVGLNAFDLLEDRLTNERAKLKQKFENDIEAKHAGFLSRCQVSLICSIL